MSWHSELVCGLFEAFLSSTLLTLSPNVAFVSNGDVWRYSLAGRGLDEVDKTCPLSETNYTTPLIKSGSSDNMETLKGPEVSMIMEALIYPSRYKVVSFS